MDPFSPAPVLRVASADGARIAVYALPSPDAPAGGGSATPLLLVHGTGSDHTTWRVAGPLLAPDRPVYAMDRRGRGASSDGAAYAAGREVEDVAAVAEALAARHGRDIAVLGHSLGGRLAIAAGPGTPVLGPVIAYESAPGVLGDPAAAGQERLLARLRADVERDDADAALARFLADGAGLPPRDLEAFRATPLWRERLTTVPTILRELDAALHDPAIGAEALARATGPVLQLVGSASPPWFRDGAVALHARLVDGRLEVVDGARHGAHHTHPRVVADAVRRFLSR